MRPARPLRTLTTALVAATVTAGIRRLDAGGGLPGGRARWLRTNHAGATVSLVEGVALAGGTAAALLAARPAAAGAVLLAAAAGGLDDLAGDGSARGLGGHLRALRDGRPTTGALKVVALGVAGLLAVAPADARVPGGTGPHTLAGAGVVAGAANLANLLDLRPGRALKVALTAALPLVAGGQPAAAAVSGAGLVVLPDDLAGRTMLGDTGANPLGAAVGAAAAHRMGPRGRWATLAVLTGLTLASERVSFTRVIESTPVLRTLDRWGRQR
ncbi:hypothetical protein [Ornithinimicrobium sp. CNJ-824]|uniref:hypothetical protein n=1 Tax=Ornithinimicrobium sp. CNJ-824 TaxID=1904966 RepID=UPI00096A6D5B|nr:hypothetical protein [Ornithinimicrobium sp. CNJ-824]